WAKDPVTGLVVPREQYEAAYRALPIVKQGERTLVDLSGLELPAATRTVEEEADEITSEGAEESSDAAIAPEALATDVTYAHELRHFSNDEINDLCERGIVFLTSYEKDGKEYGGSILAKSWESAE